MSSSARAASVGCGLLALLSAADAFTGSLKMSLGAAAPGESPESERSQQLIRN